MSAQCAGRTAFSAAFALLLLCACAAARSPAPSADGEDVADAQPAAAQGSARYKIEGFLVFDGKGFGYSVADEGALPGVQPAPAVADGAAAIPPPPAGWETDTRVLLNNGERVAFVRGDGSFVFEDVLPGGYVLQVQSPFHIFPLLRVDVGSKSGRVKVRLASLVLGGAVGGVTLPYPIQLRPRGVPSYFQPRDGFKLRDVLFSPMGLMVVMTVFMMVVFPRLLGSLSPEELREMRESSIFNIANQQGQNTPDVLGRLAQSQRAAQAPSPTQRSLRQ